MNLILAKKNHFFLLALFIVVLLASCARAPIMSPAMREQQATQLAQANQWQQLSINTPSFVLVGYIPKKIEQHKTLTIYIEGDGFAWQTSSTPSVNPTPMNPLALKLALAHFNHSHAVAYLARPCQYVSAMEWKACSQPDWTSARFSKKVIDASNYAIDELKQRFGASELTLVGYSGGGAVAALVAAQRNDVTYLVTVAGNMETDYWVKENSFKPLKGSLNPADQAKRLMNIPQLHFVGLHDRTVSPNVIKAYAKHFPCGAKPEVKIMPDFDHECCWAEQWATLFK